MERDDECHAASYTPNYSLDKCLLPNLLDTLHLHFLRPKTVLLVVACVCFVHEIATFVHVVGAAEHGVHLFQHDPLCLRDEEVDEDGKQDVDAGEHVESIEATILRGELEPATRIHALRFGLTVRKVGKNWFTTRLAMFCVCEAMPTAWARMFMENTSEVQIQTVAPQDGL
jgi:hypothetical protein